MNASTPAAADVTFDLDGVAVVVTAGGSLLEALRDELGVTSAKDGCSPQGQCGCCTVLVDGSPRVACVTPVERVAGRAVTTVDGLADAEAWAEAFAACGASQCGFCTPGIITRLSALPASARGERGVVDRALRAHLCRCTGWQTIREACGRMAEGSAEAWDRDRDDEAAARRAHLEGGVPQRIGPEVALGRGGFGDDGAPRDALVAVRGADGEWVMGETLSAARHAAGKVQGRRTTAPTVWPVELPAGDWATTLRTTWVEPAYLEPDSAWCAPGGTPTSALGNGGAFGGKLTSDVGVVARGLADEHGRPVRVLWSREDVVRLGPKRPPLAIGLHPDGTGLVRAARPTVGPVELGAVLPQGVRLEWVDVDGPPVSLAVRAAVLAEVLAAHAVARLEPDAAAVSVTTPAGATAAAEFVDGPDGEALALHVECGDVLDEVTARSYCIGAAHMALGMVRSESLALDDVGHPHDLTIRSFGVLRSSDTPHVEVGFSRSDRPPVNAGDAVFAAVLGVAWRRAGSPDRWPV